MDDPTPTPTPTPGVALVADTPTPPPEVAPVTMIALRQAAPPVVDPAIAPAPVAPDLPSADDIRVQMAAELEATKAARKAVENIASLERKGRLLANLRLRGATATLSDTHLMLLAPDIDPDTPDGLAALETFQTANSALFSAAQVTAVETSQQIFDSIPKAPNRKLFGDAYVQQLIRHCTTESRFK